jgi:peptidoglycan/LPS O-acetylase OafA/YrhL
MFSSNGSIHNTVIRNTNNFDFLRFSAATLVILTHSYGLLGINNDLFSTLNGYMSLGGLGVAIFFLISGYLICKSWENKPEPINYFWKRSLHIIPGLVGASLFTVFVIGLLVTNISKINYLTSIDTWTYFFRVIGIFSMFKMSDSLPGVFTNNIYPIAVNGSLWTLPIEATMYVILFLIGFIGLLKKKSIIPISIASMVLLYIFSSYTPILSNYLMSFLNLATYFFIGIVFYIYREHIRFDYKIAVFLLSIWLISFKSPLYQYISYITISYIVFYIAFLKIDKLNNFGAHGDFSYGLYIYGCPIQQTIVYVSNGNLTIISMFSLSMILTFVMAFLSWHLIENKALKLKTINIRNEIRKLGFFIS